MLGQNYPIYLRIGGLYFSQDSILELHWQIKPIVKLMKNFVYKIQELDFDESFRDCTCPTWNSIPPWVSSWLPAISMDIWNNIYHDKKSRQINLAILIHHSIDFWVFEKMLHACSEKDKKLFSEVGTSFSEKEKIVSTWLIWLTSCKSLANWNADSTELSFMT